MKEKNIVKIDINIERISRFITRHLDSAPRLRDDVPPFSVVEISVNGMCNRRCIFCPRVKEEDFPNINENLSLMVYESLIDELSDMEYMGLLSFSGFCEPLMTKNLEDYIRYAKCLCPGMTIKITSNGDYITKKRVKDLFSSGLDYLSLSLYDNQKDIHEFYSIKKELKLTDKQFVFRKRYIDDEVFHNTISNRAGGVTLKTKDFELKPLDKPLPQPCYYPFYKIFIDYNGDVVICSNDFYKKLVVANIYNNSIYECWASTEFNKARLRLINSDRKFMPCDICSVNGTLNGKKHFKKWMEYFGYG